MQDHKLYLAGHLPFLSFAPLQVAVPGIDPVLLFCGVALTKFGVLLRARSEADEPLTGTLGGFGADIDEGTLVAARCVASVVGLDANREESGFELRALVSED